MLTATCRQTSRAYGAISSPSIVISARTFRCLWRKPSRACIPKRLYPRLEWTAIAFSASVPISFVARSKPLDSFRPLSASLFLYPVLISIANGGRRCRREALEAALCGRWSRPDQVKWFLASDLFFCFSFLIRFRFWSSSFGNKDFVSDGSSWSFLALGSEKEKSGFIGLVSRYLRYIGPLLKHLFRFRGQALVILMVLDAYFCDEILNSVFFCGDWEFFLPAIVGLMTVERRSRSSGVRSRRRLMRLLCLMIP